MKFPHLSIAVLASMVFPTFASSLEWVQMGDAINGNANYENFGESVAMSGDGNVFVAGAPFATNYTGYAQVFEYKGKGWAQLGGDILGQDIYEIFGYSVDISSKGDTIVIVELLTMTAKELCVYMGT